MPLNLPLIKERLLRAGVQNPDQDIERITEFVTNGGPVTLENEERILNLLKRRENREPIERIIGYSKFLDHAFELADGVFKPNFETETTTEHALILAEKFDRPVRILDLGTGTGCILISLLKNLPAATGVGVDLNQAALDLAQRNAEKHQVADRCEFYLSDWTEGIDGTFDIIVSNPPRIPQKLIPSLVTEVAKYDPREAIDGGKNGLLFYERLAKSFHKIAHKDTVCIIQAGEIIIEKAASIFAKNSFSDIQIWRDYKYAPNCISFKMGKAQNIPRDSFLKRIISRLYPF